MIKFCIFNEIKTAVTDRNSADDVSACPITRLWWLSDYLPAKLRKKLKAVVCAYFLQSSILNLTSRVQRKRSFLWTYHRLSEWLNLAVHRPSLLPQETNKDARIPTNFRGYLNSKYVVYTKRQFIYT